MGEVSFRLTYANAIAQNVFSLVTPKERNTKVINISPTTPCSDPFALSWTLAPTCAFAARRTLPSSCMLVPRWTAPLTGTTVAFWTFGGRAIRDCIFDGNVEGLSVGVLIVKGAFTFYVMKV